MSSTNGQGAATTSAPTSVVSDTNSATSITSSPTPASPAVPTIGQLSNGPVEVAYSYCFPTSASGAAPGFPCWTMQAMNDACYYGPSVVATATATPTTHQSPQAQHDCYCDPDGVGYDYFDYISGCASCFRLHGAAGYYGAYDANFVSILSSAYCAQISPTINFGQFLTSLQAAEQVTFNADIATTDILGTTTDVSLYFTSTFGGAASSGTSSSSSSSSASAVTVLPGQITNPFSSSTASSGGAAATTSASGGSSGSSGLSQAGKIGVGVGVGVGGALILAALAGFLLFRRRKARSNYGQYRNSGMMGEKGGPALDNTPGLALD